MVQESFSAECKSLDVQSISGEAVGMAVMVLKF
jgi:hypothetical protein